MRDLARRVLDGDFDEIESWRTSEDPVKQAVYDLAVEVNKKRRGPEYDAALNIFRRLQSQSSVRMDWDSYRIEDEILEWETIIKNKVPRDR